MCPVHNLRSRATGKAVCTCHVETAPHCIIQSRTPRNIHSDAQKGALGDKRRGSGGFSVPTVDRGVNQIPLSDEFAKLHLEKSERKEGNLRTRLTAVAPSAERVSDSGMADRTLRKRSFRAKDERDHDVAMADPTSQETQSPDAVKREEGFAFTGPAPQRRFPGDDGENFVLYGEGVAMSLSPQSRRCGSNREESDDVVMEGDNREIATVNQNEITPHLPWSGNPPPSTPRSRALSPPPFDDMDTSNFFAPLEEIPIRQRGDSGIDQDDSDEEY